MSRDFYSITHEGVQLELPRVTSILRIIDKSQPLMGWATKLERAAMKAALEEVLTDPSVSGFDQVYRKVSDQIAGKRAWLREMDKARDIGSQAHQLIEWHVHKQLGLDPGDEPPTSDAALRAVVAWLDWSREVDFTPLYAELVVYCPFCGYAGTLDCVAKVKGQVTLVDWKTGKAVYPEAFLQNIAYRHAALRDGIKTEGGLIVRLPKTAEDPLTEAVPVPPTDYLEFLAARILWTWQQRMDKQPVGPPLTKCPLRFAL